MDEYNVMISVSAQNDFLEIAERINLLPPDEAEQYFDKVIKKTKVLATAPDSCPSARDSQLRLRGYRTLTIDDYVYFFVISKDDVIIRRILYAKSQYDRIS
jgi:plasmid stabilization system protein ParE